MAMCSLLSDLFIRIRHIRPISHEQLLLWFAGIGASTFFLAMTLRIRAPPMSEMKWLLWSTMNRPHMLRTRQETKNVTISDSCTCCCKCIGWKSYAHRAFFSFLGGARQCLLCDPSFFHFPCVGVLAQAFRQSRPEWQLLLYGKLGSVCVH